MKQTPEKEVSNHTESTSSEAKSPKKPMRSVWVIFWLILFFPVGLYFMWAKSSWKRIPKIVISILYALLVVSSLGSGFPESNNTGTAIIETTAETETEKEILKESETEIVQETAIESESASGPKPNSSGMVDYIAKEAKASANIGASEEKREEAISFIRDNYPNYFSDNETMEKTMYYGYYLEYAYSKNGSENIYANLGIDAYQAVKGVYRNVDKVEDDIVQENLRQIEEGLSKLQSENVETTVSADTQAVLSETQSPTSEAQIQETEASAAPVQNIESQNTVPTSAPQSTEQITVYITETGSKYHKAGCSSLSKSKIPISLDDAVKNYEPCGRCHPPIK
ncbi:putative uncharacterized protein [Clostridium sp. CAG:149]|nr:putative uncharacterized protein [Clostridium sp. CAG:149]